MRFIVLISFFLPLFITSAHAAKFSCASMPRYCKGVKSCAAACFYRYQCGATKFDRDHDNKPCENVCKRTCRKSEMKRKIVRVVPDYQRWVTPPHIQKLTPTQRAAIIRINNQPVTEATDNTNITPLLARAVGRVGTRAIITRQLKKTTHIKRVKPIGTMKKPRITVSPKLAQKLSRIPIVGKKLGALATIAAGFAYIRNEANKKYKPTK